MTWIHAGEYLIISLLMASGPGDVQVLSPPMIKSVSSWSMMVLGCRGGCSVEGVFLCWLSSCGLLVGRCCLRVFVVCVSAVSVGGPVVAVRVAPNSFLKCWTIVSIVGVVRWVLPLLWSGTVLRSVSSLSHVSLREIPNLLERSSVRPSNICSFFLRTVRCSFLFVAKIAGLAMHN